MSTPKTAKDTRPLQGCYQAPQPMFTLCPTCRTLVLGHIVMQWNVRVWMGAPLTAALGEPHVCYPPQPQWTTLVGTTWRACPTMQHEDVAAAQGNQLCA
jgi:hypothetical protein